MRINLFPVGARIIAAYYFFFCEGQRVFSYVVPMFLMFINEMLIDRVVIDRLTIFRTIASCG